MRLLLLATRYSLLATAFVLCTNAALAWGGTGHRVIAALAEANLSPKAKATIEKYLDGQSIVEFASWMDHVRETPEYKYSNGWHTAPVDAKLLHTDSIARKTGDAITATIDSIKTLVDYQKKRPETVALHIKFLVHMIPDFHCPGHVSYSSITYSFDITANGKAVPYHDIWDSHVVDAHKLSLNQWVKRLNTLSVDEIHKIRAGSPRDWFHQNALDSLVIYKWVKPGAKLNDDKYTDFIAKSRPLTESQMQKAGYRLAGVLNALFGR